MHFLPAFCMLLWLLHASSIPSLACLRLICVATDGDLVDDWNCHVQLALLAKAGGYR